MEHSLQLKSKGNVGKAKRRCIEMKELQSKLISKRMATLFLDRDLKEKVMESRTLGREASVEE